MNDTFDAKMKQKCVFSLMFQSNKRLQGRTSVAAV